MPKFSPDRVTLEPVGPIFGVILSNVGGQFAVQVTLKFTELLLCPFAVTTTGPVRAFNGTVAEISLSLQTAVGA